MTQDALTLLWAALVLYVPGIAVLTALRCRVPFRIGLAPAATAGIFGVLGMLMTPLGIEWSQVTAAIGVGAVTAAAGAAGFALSRTGLARERPQSGPRGVLARVLTLSGCAAAAAILILPLRASGMHLDSLLPAFDAIFHYNGVAFVRSGGQATPWTALAGMYGPAHPYYPVSLHLIASLVPGGVVEATNATILVVLGSSGFTMASLLWTVAPRSVPLRLRAVVIAATIPTVTLFFSIPVMTLLMGLWPNALAAVVFPAVLAAVLNAIRVADAVRRQGTWRGRARHALELIPEALVIGGGILIHPSIAFDLLVVVFALAIMHTVLLARSDRRRALIQALVLVAVLVIYDVIGATVLRGMALTSKTEEGIWTTVLTLLADRPRLTAIPLKAQYAMVVVALAAVGIAQAWRSRSRLRLALVAFGAVSFVLALGTAYSFTPLSSLANPWYQARERVVPLLTCALVPLACVGACLLLDRVRRRRPPLLVPATVLVVLALVVPAILTATSAQRLPAMVRLMAPRPDGYYAVYVAPEEAEFITDSASRLPEDAVVLGDPASGAAMYWALGDRRVLFPHLGRPATAGLLEIAARAEEMDTDPQVCRLVRSQGRDLYLYRDFSSQGLDAIAAGGSQAYPGLDGISVEHLDKVSESADGRYALFRLTPPC